MSKLAQDFLAPYTPSQVAMLQSMLLALQQYGLDVDAGLQILAEYYQDILAKNSGEEKIAPNIAHPPPRSFPVCPECRHMLIVAEVNVSRCTAIGGPWKTSLMCGNKACRYTELSTKSIHEWRGGR